jgi:hypothetical protein
MQSHRLDGALWSNALCCFCVGEGAQHDRSTDFLQRSKPCLGSVDALHGLKLAGRDLSACV